MRLWVLFRLPRYNKPGMQVIYDYQNTTLWPQEEHHAGKSVDSIG